jgi:hypothetical protein
MTEDLERMKMARAIFSILAVTTALLLSACAQPQGKSGAALAPAPSADSGYRPIAMVGASEKQSEIGIDFDKLGKDQDLQLALMYGVNASAALPPEEGKAEAGLTYSGRGDSWERPVVIHGQAAALGTIDNAYRYVADHFPKSRILSSTLYAGPPPNYVTRIEFSRTEGPGALYFDLTDWAQAWRKEVPN